ncbi:MAG: acetyltransferase [Planctomycetes bacterium SM23_32]|nr:MAG: acetyltransferase [Planctomycetes bacterium SM23_32]
MVEKAHIDDAPQILALVNYYAERQLMLPRSLNDVYESLRDFFVRREEGEVVGCAALHISWQGLGEVRSLAVREGAQRQGIGSALVESCLEEARQLGMRRVFVLTYLPGFFERFGFARYAKEELPHKVWADCLNCPRFPDCDEIAMIKDL